MIKIIRFAWAFYFFFWFLLCFLLFYPAFLFLLARRSRYPKAHQLRSLWGRIIMFLSGLRPTTEYETELDGKGPYIFVANHFSYLDILSLNVQLPFYFRFLAKSELADIPMFRIFFRTIDIPVQRETIKGAFASYEMAGEALTQGESLGIFPEGGIGTKVPEMRHFKSGAFRLAMERQVPLVPITIADNWKRLPGGGLISGGTPGRMRMHVHKPVNPSDFDNIQDLMASIYGIIQKKFDEMNAD